MLIDKKYYSPKSKKPKVSSRLAKKEHKKLTQQTLIMIVSTVVILALFIFVIMPGAIRLFFKIIDQGSVFDTGDDIPPQVPVLNAPVSATHSAKLHLNGYGEAGSEVVFVLDSSELGRVDIDDEGKFEYTLGLNQGENDLVLYGVDQAGNESISTKSYKILMDNQAPIIEVESPEDGAKIELRKNQLLTIRGKTEANSKVYVNGRVSFAGSEGEFKTTYQLSEGENKLEIKVVDMAGNESRIELTVHFKL